MTVVRLLISGLISILNQDPLADTDSDFCMQLTIFFAQLPCTYTTLSGHVLSQTAHRLTLTQLSRHIAFIQYP